MTIYDVLAVAVVLASFVTGGTLWVYVARWWAARKFRNMSPEQRAYMEEQAMKVIRWHEQHKEDVK